MTQTERWTYSGDMSLAYGGEFIDMSTWNNGYLTAVRVTDLDSGCGFDGAVLIEHVTILGTTDAKRLRRAMECCGCKCRGLTKENARIMLADALLSYGFVGPDDGWDGYRSAQSEVVQLTPTGPMNFEGWKADKRLRGADLEGYIKAVHLRD